VFHLFATIVLFILLKEWFVLNGLSVFLWGLSNCVYDRRSCATYVCTTEWSKGNTTLLILSRSSALKPSST